ncbi:Uncharacterised protein [Yersinia frederiksenii]|nr:Uncharacterised protein [Yersinia frederiksenii]
MSLPLVATAFWPPKRERPTIVGFILALVPQLMLELRVFLPLMREPEILFWKTKPQGPLLPPQEYLQQIAALPVLLLRIAESLTAPRQGWLFPLPQRKPSMLIILAGQLMLLPERALMF